MIIKGGIPLLQFMKTYSFSTWTLRLGWLFILISASFLFFLTALYFSFRSDMNFLLAKPDLVNDAIWRTVFYIHVGGSMPPILLGALQFVPSLRKNYPKLHRKFGEVYVFSILILAAPSGFYMAFFANGGFWAGTGFIILAVLWIISTYKAYTTALQKDYQTHRIWMVRSYALTFSAVTLRIWVPILSLFSPIEGTLIIILTAWLNWIPNLVIGEILLVFFPTKM